MVLIRSLKDRPGFMNKFIEKIYVAQYNGEMNTIGFYNKKKLENILIHQVNILKKLVIKNSEGGGKE